MGQSPDTVATYCRRAWDSLRPAYDGPAQWLWFAGAARLGILLVVAAGATLDRNAYEFTITRVLIYTLAFASSLWYFVALRREQGISARLTWTQMLVDFGVVASTISFTGGERSFYTSLLVIVILEAGVLMGIIQGFLFATLATAFMFMQSLYGAALAKDQYLFWYNFLIQSIAFFFTAFISGYWNQRVSGMKQFQREILDNLNSGFLITDEKGLVMAINRAGCQILALKEGDVAGRHVEGIVRPRSGAECPITTALRSQKDFSSYEFFAETGNHEAKLLGLTTNRIHDMRGHLTGVIATFTDLTEMARMRQELQKQDRMAVVGELSAGLAHEIRNPVAAIRGAMDEIRGNTGNTAMVAKLAAIAVRESDHLNEIVSGFLDFARDPSRRREVIDLRDAVQETIDTLVRKYDASPLLRITSFVPKTPCPVFADHTQLRQVFMNLGQNAVEAMHEDGLVHIAVDQGPRYFEVRIDDTGPGIDPDKVARIFEPFYTEKEHGVGMGLAICMRLVTAHDGTIQVASRPRGGTSMTVRLPAARE
jgi:two-component system sensor histidine kinase PilS (NtrC family)